MEDDGKMQDSDEEDEDMKDGKLRCIPCTRYPMFVGVYS